MVKDLSTRKSKRKHNGNSCRFDHRTKSVMIVDTFFLIKSFSNETGFVAFKSAISLTFDPINLFRINDPLVCWRRNQDPIVVATKGINFLGHSFTPMSTFVSYDKGTTWSGK